MNLKEVINVMPGTKASISLHKEISNLMYSRMCVIEKECVTSVIFDTEITLSCINLTVHVIEKCTKTLTTV